MVKLTIELSEEKAAALDRLAAERSLSRSEIMADAIEKYFGLQDWQLAKLREGIEQLERGEGVPHELVEPWLRDLENGIFRDPPK